MRKLILALAATGLVAACDSGTAPEEEDTGNGEGAATEAPAATESTSDLEAAAEKAAEDAKKAAEEGAAATREAVEEGTKTLEDAAEDAAEEAKKAAEDDGGN